MLCAQVFADDSFCATTSSSPRRTISTMDVLCAEMERAKAGFAGAEAAAARAGAETPAQPSRFREEALTQAAEARTENLTRLRSDTAAAAPAPAPLSPGVALLRREMAAVKGQPNLLERFEEIINAAERQRKRAARHGGSSAAGCPPHQVFGGPSGTGKSSSVKVVSKVLASPEVALLKKPSVVTLNKDTDLSKMKGTQPQIIRSFFEKAVGGILFLDEVHRRPKEFAQALLTPLDDFQGKVMVIIAGYDENVRKWLRDCDPGLPSRFPGRVEFLPLSADTLVEIGMDRMVDPKEYSVPYSLDPSARAVFRCVMAHVSARAEPCDLPLNGRGAKVAVDAMIRKHDARPGLDVEDMRITTEDILNACPFAASPPPVAAASQHARATADASGEAAAAAAAEQAPAAAAPAAAGEAAARGAPRRAAVAESSSAGVAAGATSGSEKTHSDSGEDTPPSKRARLDPAPSKSPAPASSGERKAEVEEIVGAIDAVCKPDPSSDPISAWDLLQKLHRRKRFKEGSVVHETVSQSKLGPRLKRWTIEAIESISARGGDSETVRSDETKDHKLMIYGLHCR